MSEWHDIENAPKDKPVLVYYDHDADPYFEPGETGRLTAYGANAEGGDFLPGTGYVVAQWCDGYHDDDGPEDPTGGYWVPGGWFPWLNGEPMDCVCNAVFWKPIAAPEAVA